MMNINKLFFTFVFSALSLSALSLELEKGLLYQTAMPATLDGYKEYYLSHSLPGNSFSYIKNSRSDYSYYTLNRENIIFDADLVPKTAKSFFVNETIVNKWPLTPWAHHLFLAGEYDAAREESSQIRGLDLTVPKDPLQVVGGLTANYYNHSNYASPGCLNKIPLRYGDIDGDGVSELAVFSDDTVVFFSPQQGKVIFSYHYQLNDEMTADDAVLVFLPPYQDTDPQYIAGSGQDELVREIFPAQRSLSKIYIQDFNGDKIPDIVLWRKMYRSNLRNNSVQGFHLLAETWVHYQLTDGEYLLQDSAPEAIQNWLSTAQLTWSKGFPSLSECPGEEGKLISEMHDPLLNDPDVLQ